MPGRLIERALQIGAASSLSLDVSKRIRLSNLLGLWGCAIMVPWLVVELLFGKHTRCRPIGLPACC
jgi:hypothetical protein